MNIHEGNYVMMVHCGSRGIMAINNIRPHASVHLGQFKCYIDWLFGP